MNLRPISLKEAAKFVGEFHRHHGEPAGGKFAIAAEHDGKVVGVVIAGRPVSRGLDDGWNAEVTRLCTDGSQNACSLLYGAAARAAKAMGYRAIYTYTLASECGASLRASGWLAEARTAGGSWNCDSRPRRDRHPTEPKIRWRRALRAAEHRADFRTLVSWASAA